MANAVIVVDTLRGFLEAELPPLLRPCRRAA